MPELLARTVPDVVLLEVTPLGADRPEAIVVRILSATNVDEARLAPAWLAAHIFMPFFSTRKQRRGIGLALVRHLAHANGGTLRHARPVGVGACFLLSF